MTARRKSTQRTPRARGTGSITSYATKSGTRWRFEIAVPVDPARPEEGDRNVSRGGFTSCDEADRLEWRPRHHEPGPRRQALDVLAETSRTSLVEVERHDLLRLAALAEQAEVSARLTAAAEEAPTLPGPERSQHLDRQGRHCRRAQ